MAGTLAAPTPADPVRGWMDEVEQVLERASASEVEVLQAAARHILSAGGKRIRPHLTLLVTSALGGSLARAVPLAAACELVHTATLVHDDIVDESDSRRGRMAVQFYYGNSASVLMGDFLVIRSFGLVHTDPDREIWRLMVDTIARMCEGEVLQICVKGDTAIGVDVYETVIECKTALLISTCTRIGARISGAGGAAIEALTAFGYNLGMAFQIQDDILDFTGSKESLGKPIGGDLREGKVTLPVIYALQDASGDDRKRLLRTYEKAAPLSDQEIAAATSIIERSGGFLRATDHAREYIRRARLELERVLSAAERAPLERLAGQIVDRHR